MAWGQKFPGDSSLGLGTEVFRPGPVFKQGGDLASKPLQVVGFDQDPAPPALDLILDTADPTRHHGARLPHRLGHRQAEALGEALLHHDGRMPLERVDDYRVLITTAAVSLAGGGPQSQ